jgi:hypothetical protein
MDRNLARIFGRAIIKLMTVTMNGRRTTTGNSTFAIGGVTCFYDTFVVNGSAVLRMNICAEKPAHRKSAKRYLFQTQ